MPHFLPRAAAAFVLVCLGACAQPAVNPPRSDVAPPAPQAAAPPTPPLSPAQAATFASLLATLQANARANPTNLTFRRFEPLLRLQTGDPAGWAQSRVDLTQAWTRLRGTGAPPPVPPGFVIDLIAVGTDRILVDQCYQRAGRWGVLYRFTVIGPDKQTHAFFTVEQSDLDAAVARQLHNPAPVTLDYFTPGHHATVAILNGTPDYSVWRARVLQFLNDHQVVSVSSGGPPVLSNEGCALDPSG